MLYTDETTFTNAMQKKHNITNFKYTDGKTDEHGRVVNYACAKNPTVTLESGHYTWAVSPSSANGHMIQAGRFTGYIN